MLTKPDLIQITEAEVVSLVNRKPEDIRFIPVAMLMQSGIAIRLGDRRISDRKVSLRITAVTEIFGVKLRVSIQRLIEGVGLL